MCSDESSNIASNIPREAAWLIFYFAAGTRNRARPWSRSWRPKASSKRNFWVAYWRTKNTKGKPSPPFSCGKIPATKNSAVKWNKFSLNSPPSPWWRWPRKTWRFDFFAHFPFPVHFSRANIFFLFFRENVQVEFKRDVMAEKLLLRCWFFAHFRFLSIFTR